jgi:hypothetical protein
MPLRAPTNRLSAVLEESRQRGVQFIREWIDDLDAAPDKTRMQILCQEQATARPGCDGNDHRIPDAECMRRSKIGGGAERFGRRVGGRKASRQLMMALRA